MSERIVQVQVEKQRIVGVDEVPPHKDQFAFVLRVSRYDDYADALADGLEAARLLSSAHLGEERT